jgi:hypothetical protein
MQYKHFLGQITILSLLKAFLSEHNITYKNQSFMKVRPKSLLRFGGFFPASSGYGHRRKKIGQDQMFTFKYLNCKMFKNQKRTESIDLILKIFKKISLV